MAGRIPESDIDRVRAATDLVALASERMALKRSGRRFVGRCPFHDEKTPSFSINPETGLYYCFGCGASGNVFQFLMGLDAMSFTDAVEALARRSGISITYTDDSPDDRRRRERKPKLEEVLAHSVAHLHRQLMTHPDAGIARTYLKGRGYDKDVATRFSLGWSPPVWDDLVKSCKKAGYLEEDMIDAGVASRSSRGSAVDFLRGRLVFPIFDPQGKPVALAGRILDVPGEDPQGPKYLNTPETSLYHKSRTLYGLNWARTDIVARDEAVIVEGYTDVIGFHLAGATNAVATCGTALGEEHLRLLKRYAPRVVLAFDGDTAGAAATERTFSVAADVGLEVWVAVLPPGKDPAELAADGIDAVDALLARRRPLLEFKIEREIARHPVDTLEGEARALDAAAAAIAAHPDPTVRSAAARQVARRFRDVTEDQVVAKVDGTRRANGGGRTTTRRPPPPGGASSSPERRPAVKVSKVEQFALAALIQSPHATLDAAPELTPAWFVADAARDLAAAVLSAVDATEPGRPVDVERCALADDLVAPARRLAVLQVPGFEGDDDLARFVVESVHSLERSFVQRRIAELQHEMRRAEAEGNLASVGRIDSDLVTFIDRMRALGGV